jgi:hypothetical protein
MSLRDFNNTSFPDDPTALHHDAAGNESGLGNFHTVQPEDIEPNNTPKIVGAIAVALMVGVAGVALYASQGSSTPTKQMVAAAPAAPAPVASPPAAAPMPAAETPAAAPEPVAKQATKAAKAATSEPNSLRAALVKTPAADTNKDAGASDAMAARMAAANDANQVNTQPQEQAAITPSTPAPDQQAATPLPSGPSPSPSDLATNNTQSGVAVPQGAVTASDIPNPAPAQGADRAPSPTPEPVQPSAQPSGQIAQ